MKDYFSWSLRQFYLLFFWPTQFRREVEGENPDQPRLKFSERLPYLLKMLPFMVALGVFGNIIPWYICRAFGIAFKWEYSWVGVAVGAASGVAVGAASGVARGMVWGMAFGVVFGSLYGVGIVTASTSLLGIAVLGVAFGIAGGMISALHFDSLKYGAVAGLLMSVSVSLMGISIGRAAVGIMISVISAAALWMVYFRVMMYPFDAALSAAAYLVAQRRPRMAMRAWRWCPVAWNEVIWLPLPLVGELLALMVKQDREEGFKRITFVAAERRLQRRAALDALVEVAFDDMKADSIKELAEVSEKLGWTVNTPTELPFELMTALPTFDRAAQHVAQYLTLNNAFRKSEALDRALSEVKSSQINNIIGLGGYYAPRLLQVANEWRGLLEAERERVGALAEASREIPNPFVFGNPVVETEHNVFTGRRDIVRQIEANMLGAAQAPTLLLHGPRRMGKTSILNQLPRLLGPDFAPAIVDCQNPAVTESRTTMLRYLSRACGEGLRQRHVRVEPLTAAKLEREPFAVFDEWLDTVERAMPAGMRALLCLDEYERLQATLDAGWGGAFLDALRHTLQHRPRVVLMFTGAHTFQELGPAWTDRFISARRVRVSFLGRGDVELLLTRPIPEFDMKYAPGALDAVVAATSYQPFLTQAVAFELVQHLNERQRREATPEDVEEAVARALVSGGEYFANVWSDAGAEGQAILRALAAGESSPEFPAARAWLREHDVLDGGGRFAVEMMRRWVRARLESPVRGGQPF